MNRLFVFLTLVGFGLLLNGQNTRTVEPTRQLSPQYPSEKTKNKSSSAKKTQQLTTNESEVAAFRARMKKVFKEKAKEEKIADKKRYSEHGYFGHKRPPKKRPPDKMKFCQVCQIKH